MRIHVALDDPIANAAADGADCVQVILSDPRGWRAPRARDGAARHVDDLAWFRERVA